MRILSNSAKFSADQPLLPEATRATTYSTYRLGAMASLKFLAIENMTPNFSAHVYYGKTSGCVRIPLGTKIGLGPGDIMLDGDPASPPRKGTQQLSHFLARIPAGPHFTHNPYCELSSERRAALVTILPDKKLSPV